MPPDRFWASDRPAPVEVPERSATGNTDYDALPVSIRALYPFRTWLWLSDAQKASLVQTETEPEWDE